MNDHTKLGLTIFVVATYAVVAIVWQQEKRAFAALIALIALAVLVILIGRAEAIP